MYFCTTMRIQSLKYDKNCVVCNRAFVASRKHAETCSEACRAQKNANKRALIMVKPLIIAEARESLKKETEAKYDAIVVPNEFKKLVTELASLQGWDKIWIDRELRLYQYLMVDDCHHGYCEEEAINGMKERIEYFKMRGQFALPSTILMNRKLK